MSYVSVPRECCARAHLRVSHKSVLRECPARVPPHADESVALECPTRAFYTSVSHKSVENVWTFVLECVFAFGFVGSIYSFNIDQFVLFSTCTRKGFRKKPLVCGSTHLQHALVPLGPRETLRMGFYDWINMGLPTFVPDTPMCTYTMQGTNNRRGNGWRWRFR